MYGVETQTILKVQQKRIEAIETWCWKKTLKISWTEKVENEDLYLRINEWKLILKKKKEMRKKWIGHTMRNNE